MMFFLHYDTSSLLNPKYLNISFKDIYFQDTSGGNMSTQDLDEIVSDFSRFYVLTILYEAPHHGYSIIAEFKKRIGKDISPSLVYPFLSQLEKKGLVKHSLKTVGHKKKKVFELTEKGRKLCRTLFKRFSAIVSVAIEPSLAVCASCGCKVYEGGHREIINGEELTFCCVHCAESYKAETSGKSARQER
jgi:DNA-binding PadR family transcriptional regulator